MTRRRLLGRALLLSLAATGIALVLGTTSFLSSDPRISTNPWKPAGSVARVRSEGTVYLSRHRVFLVNGPGGILALSGISTHLGGRIAHCRSSGWFEDLAHGSKWDGLGFYLDGPAPRGMDRVALRVLAGLVEVKPSAETAGPPRGAGPPTQPAGPFCTTDGATVRNGFFLAE